MIIGKAGDGVYIDDLVHRPAEDDGYLGELSRMRLEVELLRNENAELRKLVRQLYEFAYREYPDSAELNFADRMRELGVEV